MFRSLFTIICFVFLVLVSCSKGGDRPLDAVGRKPDYNKVLQQGSDKVRNILFLKDETDKALYSEIRSNLIKSGILDGGHEDNGFHSGEFFLLDSLGYDPNLIERKSTFVFLQEDSAIIIYEAPKWILIETITW